MKMIMIGVADDYKCVNRVRISNGQELLEFIEQYKEQCIFSYRVNGNPKGILSEGIDIRIGRYARVVEEFVDPFDFPDGFYKHQIFLPKKEGELCLEFIFPNMNQYEDQKRMVTVSDILRLMQEHHLGRTKEIPVISADTNFELKGSLTDNMYLDVYTKKDTNEEYVIADMYV